MTARTIKKTFTIAAMIAGTSTLAAAATINTAPIQPVEGQKLVCTVVNVKNRPLDITAQIIDRWGNNVTTFIRTDWDATETVLLTVRAESSANVDARYCKVTVSRRKSDVTASLQACNSDESVCSAAVSAR